MARSGNGFILRKTEKVKTGSMLERPLIIFGNPSVDQIR